MRATLALKGSNIPLKFLIEVNNYAKLLFLLIANHENVYGNVLSKLLTEVYISKSGLSKWLKLFVLNYLLYYLA